MVLALLKLPINLNDPLSIQSMVVTLFRYHVVELRGQVVYNVMMALWLFIKSEH